MLTLEKYAAIDIGSNAIRLLICSVYEKEGKKPKFKKTSLVRVPIRLGADVFRHGSVCNSNIYRMIDAMKAYQLLMRTHRVLHYKAFATSAMRDAQNSKEILALIFSQTRIQIDIIDGKREAEIIAMTDLQDLIQSAETYLYVDVGGGSTEFTLFHHGQAKYSKSFKLGSVRLLNKQVPQKTWEEAEEWVRKHTAAYPRISLIGSGGNINTIFKRSGKKIDQPLSFLYLSQHYNQLCALTYEERIWKLKLNPDRADVIVPATKIYLSAMKWSEAKHIFVPKIGLADGMIKYLYTQKKDNH